MEAKGLGNEVRFTRFEVNGKEELSTCRLAEAVQDMAVDFRTKKRLGT
jgi:hypothetical protein